VLSARAARNMAFQDKTPQFGVAQCLLELKGSELLGCGVAAPLAFNEVIYGLPMLTILMTKGTGIVTSVPSDAPDDYMALQDLKKKPAMREKFGIKDEWVMPFEVRSLNGPQQSPPRAHFSVPSYSRNRIVAVLPVNPNAFSTLMTGVTYPSIVETATRVDVA